MRVGASSSIECALDVSSSWCMLLSWSDAPASHMDSQLVEHAVMCSSSSVLREILYYLLLFHEIMVDPRLKQHPKVLFLSETLPSQYESVYPLSLKS
jgi:hypothetical protein